MLYSGASFDMMRPASRRRRRVRKPTKCNTPGGVPERPKGADCKSAVIDFEGSNPSPATIFKIYARPDSIKNQTPLAGFPSGQREQTVNLPSSTSKVRILPPPPFFATPSQLIQIAQSSIFPLGKDEKLRLRFDSSEARKRCRRQRPEGRDAKRRVILPPPPFFATPPNKFQIAQYSTFFVG